MAGLDIDTTKLQLKLRAIAKHTEALADELKGIDQEVCPDCGSADVRVTISYCDTKVYARTYDCDKCNHHWSSRASEQE